MRTWLAISAVFPCFIVVVAAADEEPASSAQPGGGTRVRSGDSPRDLELSWDGTSWVLARDGVSA